MFSILYILLVRMVFPKDVANIIAGYAASVRLVSWVKPSDVFNTSLIGNPNALDAIIPDEFGGCIDLETLEGEHKYGVLANPDERVREWFERRKHDNDWVMGRALYHLAKNPASWAGEAFVYYITHPKEWSRESESGFVLFSHKDLLGNPGQWAIELTDKWLLADLYPELMYSNPNRVKEIQARDQNALIHGIWEYPISANPDPWVVNFVDTNGIRDFMCTCGNPNPNLIGYIREHYEAGESVDLVALASNPNIFTVHQEDIVKIREAILKCEF